MCSNPLTATAGFSSPTSVLHNANTFYLVFFYIYYSAQGTAGAKRRSPAQLAITHPPTFHSQALNFMLIWQASVSSPLKGLLSYLTFVSVQHPLYFSVS